MSDTSQPPMEYKAHHEIKTPMQDPKIEHISTQIEGLKQSLEESIERKMQETQDYVEKISTQLQRPLLPGIEHANQHYEQKQYKKAFTDYIRRGNDTLLKSLEKKAYRANATGAEGGFLVAPHLDEAIHGRVKTLSPMRNIAHTVQSQFTSLEFLMDPDDYASGWVSETAARPETSTGLLRKITILTNDLYAMPKVTQRLLDDNFFNVDEWIAQRVAEQFALSENNAFINGSGVDQPKGFLSHNSVDNNSHSWGSLGYIATGDVDGFDPVAPADVLVDTIYALSAIYRHGSVWLMNSKTAAIIRKMKDSEGRFLWQDMADMKQNPHLLGYPVYISEDMPDIGANATPIAFGNFKRGYTIVDNGSAHILRDPYSAKPNVFFYVVKRVGGDITDFNAIKLIKCAV